MQKKGRNYNLVGFLSTSKIQSSGLINLILVQKLSLIGQHNKMQKSNAKIKDSIDRKLQKDWIRT